MGTPGGFSGGEREENILQQKGCLALSHEGKERGLSALKNAGAMGRKRREARESRGGVAPKGGRGKLLCVRVQRKNPHQGLVLVEKAPHCQRSQRKAEVAHLGRWGDTGRDEQQVKSGPLPIGGGAGEEDAKGKRDVEGRGGKRAVFGRGRPLWGEKEIGRLTGMPGRGRCEKEKLIRLFPKRGNSFGVGGGGRLPVFLGSGGFVKKIFLYERGLHCGGK